MNSLAARYYGIKDIRLEEINIPPPQSGEVILRVKRAGLCASDMRAFESGSSAVKPPIVLGHEVSGEISAVGESVTSFREGDRVCVVPDVYCGHCSRCLHGAENICENVTTLGYSINGCFSEYVRLPRIFIDNHLLYKLAESMSFDDAALIEPLSCCYHGLLRAGVRNGKTVLVVGDGPIGMMHLLLARMMGARVGMSGLIDRNLKLAESIGAEFTVNATQDPAGKVRQATGGAGADVVIVAVSLPPVIEQAMSFVSKSGVVIVFGGCAAGSRITIDPNQIHYGEVVLTGSANYTYADYRTCFQIVADNRIELEPIISDRFALRQISEALNAETNGQTIKTLIEP